MPERTRLRTLDQLRAKAGYTQKELAQKAEIAWITIARLELGENRPKSTTLQNLASVLGDEIYHLSYGWSKAYKKRGRPRREANDGN